MRAFTAQQRALAAASTIKPILLVVLTTYTDRALGTVDTVYYLADRPVMYDYGNTGTVRQFETLVLSVSDLTQSIPHVPGTTPAGLEAELRITLSNLPYRGGVPFVRELRAHNLEFATLELATVYGPLDAETGWYDLRAYTGDEHLVELRGEVEMADGIDAESFQLRVVTPEVTVPWIRADDATITDPKDLGARLPIVYGSAKRVPCVNWQVGWTTTLRQSLAIGDLTMNVTDASGLPAGTFSIYCDAEEIACSSRDVATGQVTISGRGQSGTGEANHTAGAVVIEVPSQVVVVAAGHEASGIEDVFLRNPYNNELFAVADGTRDTSLTGVVADTVIAGITFSAAQMRGLLSAAYASSRVTVQPDFTGEASYTTQTRVIVPNAVGIAYNSPADEYMSWSIQPSLVRCAFGGGAFKASAICWFSSGLSTTTVVNRFRVKLGGVGNLSHSSAQSSAVTAALYYRTIPGLPSSSWISQVYFTGSDGYRPSAVYSPWISLGQPESALNNTYFELVINLHDGDMSALDRIDFDDCGIEVEETVQAEPLLDRVTDVEVSGASVGYGLDFYADVDGPTVPATYSAGYGFEESSGWNTSGCTVAADTSNKTEGTQSIKISVTETEVESCDSGAGSWSATRCTASNDTGDKTRGTASMKLVKTTAYTTGYVLKEGLTAADWSASVVALDVKLTDAATWVSSGALTNTLGIRIGIESSATYGTDYKEYPFGANAGLGSGEWVTIVFDPATATTSSSGGTLNLAAVRGYTVILEATQYTPAILEARVDSLRLLPKTAIAQRNATSGTVTLAADALGYQLALRADDREAFGAGSKVYVSDTAGSGTTPPAARRELALDVSLIGDGAFTVQEITATDVGSPTVVDVETVGVSLAAGTNPMTLLGPPVLRIDNLRRRDDSASAYAGAVGDLIEHPADVTRHLLTARCGLADSYADTTTLDAWATNSPDVKLGADLRALGETLPELLARIGYEGRANVLRAEGAATSAYKALCAEADYTWPSSSGRALTQYKALSEVGRDGREIATRFQFLFDRDPSRGTDLSSYDGIIRANPTVSDVSVSAATLATREQKYGRRDADVGVLLAHRDEASAQDVAGYYVAEAGRDAGTFVLRGCAWWEAADLEIGDLVDVAPPWRASAVKVRAIEVTRQFGAGVVDLRAVEVA